MPDDAALDWSWRWATDVIAVGADIREGVNGLAVGLRTGSSENFSSSGRSWESSRGVSACRRSGSFPSSRRELISLMIVSNAVF